MEVYDIPCTWQMYGTYRIKAENLREAIKQCEGDLPLPSERGYISDSLRIDDIDVIYEANGIEIPKLSKEEIHEELDKRLNAELDIEKYFNPQARFCSFDDLVGVLRDYYGEEYIY